LRTTIEKIRVGLTVIDNVDYEDVFERIRNAVESGGRFSTLYANAHIVRLIKKNEDLRGALERADVVFPDGTGVWLASKLLDFPGFKKRFNWTDHGHRFLAECEERGWSIFFIGATPDAIEKAERNIKRLYPKLKFLGAMNGFEDVERTDVVERVNAAAPDVLYVGMGSPKQEVWIDRHFDELNVRVAQAVGDLFTFFAGSKVRGPRLFQRLGLEWAFRLVRHPRRYFVRYVWGIPVFLWMTLVAFARKTIGKPPWG
jgi:N-acetylglucosaminyldiphosphoundecaprenol N-acetyl-beta-D-mannosaminyltransferase